MRQMLFAVLTAVSLGSATAWHLPGIGHELEKRQNLTDVPVCAQTCLSNSTAVATSCTTLDVKCLCTNPQYVNTLSCCLATTCSTADQQKAILFNEQECASVGETAPAFVGCSPLGLSSSIVLGSGAGTTSSAASTASMASNQPVTSTAIAMSGPMLQTITGSVINITGTSTSSQITTATTYSGGALLTGSCTSIGFAIATGAFGIITEFPEIGCSDQNEGCCPYNSRENAVIEQCPQDYFTTAGACCPTGWQVYYSSIGFGQTPCYTLPLETIVPATPAATGVTLITNQVFTRRFELAIKPTSVPTTLTKGGIAGAAIGAFINVLIFAGVAWFFWRRQRAKKELLAATAERNQNMEEVYSPPISPNGPQELASPNNPPTSPHSSDWPMGSSAPPAYRNSMARTVSGKSYMPQELPGSTFIHEHHPAFTGDEASERPVTAPTTPPRSPPESPLKNATSPVVSPLGSPKALE